MSNVKSKNIPRCRVAPSLGELENTHQEAWGTKEYSFKDLGRTAVFFGLYDLRDYVALWNHKGKAYVLWAGSDLNNLRDGFMFNDGKLKWLSQLVPGNKRMVTALLRKAEHWVENQDEWQKLNDVTGIEAKVCPSFLGKISDFPVSYVWKERPDVYISGHANREEEYGFGMIENIAKRVPECNFHLYGADWKIDLPNVICHGLVSKEQFNSEIKNYHCGLRLNKSDGFSEITAKSVLMGQYPITYLHHDHIDQFKDEDELVALLKDLVNKKEPNLKGREYYARELNNYPWNYKYDKDNRTTQEVLGE